MQGLNHNHSSTVFLFNLYLMRASQSLIATLRENPADAAAVSHALFLRAGLGKKASAGLYYLLPLGLRVLRKIQNIVRREMDEAGALECQAPILTSANIWEKSGRWEQMGRELFSLQDRHENWQVLAPTHEEAFTELARQSIKSYKDLPKNLYQIHSKFRDEIRPRFGMIRAREFLMKDAYSFHQNEESLEESYTLMRKSYQRIFAKMGLQSLVVEADTGAMGGSASEEFMVVSNIGEELLLIDSEGNYKANREASPVIYSDTIQSKEAPSQSHAELKKLYTSACTSVEEVAEKLQSSPDRVLKALLYEVHDTTVLIFMRGDRELNESKLRQALAKQSIYGELRLMESPKAKALGLVPGFIGPLGLPTLSKTNTIILWDNSVKTRPDYIIGANEQDYHYQAYVPDFQMQSLDLALARAGDPSPANPACLLKESRGIELGHIFKLGQKYTKALEMQVLDEQGRAFYPWMGCYGIGINRSMSALIEQFHDEKGITWPVSVAPYEMLLIGITASEEEEREVELFYKKLLSLGCEALWDERRLRPGVKFRDAEIIGFPMIITMGKHYFHDRTLEIQLRQKQKKLELQASAKNSLEELAQKVASIRQELYQSLEHEVRKITT